MERKLSKDRDVLNTLIQRGESQDEYICSYFIRCYCFFRRRNPFINFARKVKVVSSYLLLRWQEVRFIL